MLIRFTDDVLAQYQQCTKRQVQKAMRMVISSFDDVHACWAVDTISACTLLQVRVYSVSRFSRCAVMAAVDAMTALLSERLQGVRPSLTLQATVADGNCQ